MYDVNVMNFLISCVSVSFSLSRHILSLITHAVTVGVCLVFHACVCVCVCVCQVIVHEVPGQELEVEVFDKDHDHDDFLGRYHITAFFVSHLFF